MELLLGSVGIKVQTETPVMSRAPQADILLHRSKNGPFSEAQKACLCDGLRDSKAANLFIEVKISESVTEHGVKKVMGTDTCYRESKKLKENQLEAFMISAKTPSSKFIVAAQYKPRQAGVLVSPLPGFRYVPIISLNDLPNTRHNALFKIFSSKKKQKEAAFATITRAGNFMHISELYWLLNGLHMNMLRKEVDMAVPELTSKELKEMGQIFGQSMLDTMPLEDRTAGIATGDLTNLLLSRLPEEKRVAVQRVLMRDESTPGAG